MEVDDAIKQLRSRPNGFRCDELGELLRGLGFSVTNGRNVGHKILKHRGLPDFRGSNYGCGHGANPVVKATYVRNIRRLIEERKDALKRYLEGNGR